MNPTTLLDEVRFRIGYRRFQRSGITPPSAHRALRKRYISTHGKFVERLAERVKQQNPPRPIAKGPTCLGSDYESTLDETIATIRRDGFCRLPAALSDSLVTSVRRWAEMTPALALVEDQVPGDQIKFEYVPTDGPYRTTTIHSPRYEIELAHILTNPDLTRLIADPGIAHVAQRYLEADPILDVVSMWWSRPFHGTASSSAAQLYHFDMDRIRFLKFFFYFTDVGPRTGPHCYARGSHRARPDALWRDGRIGDDEMLSAFGPSDLVELCGSAGTILAVDTVGLHKGKALQTGERLMFQLEFANSLFGATYPRPIVDSATELGQAIIAHPERFGAIQVD